jgi:hypothetical protein
MRTMRGWTRGLLAMALVLGMAILLPLPAQAGVVGLDFEGLQDLEPINNFYNGGRGGFGSGPGPSFGIVFSSTSLAVIDMDQGGSADVFAGRSCLAQAELRRPARQTAVVIVSSLSEWFNSAAVATRSKAGTLQGLDHLSGRGRLGPGGGGGDEGAGTRA